MLRIHLALKNPALQEKTTEPLTQHNNYTDHTSVGLCSEMDNCLKTVKSWIPKKICAHRKPYHILASNMQLTIGQ